MGGKWRLANGRKPKGALDRAEKFLPGPAEISACSVSVPVEMDKKEAVEAAGGLAGPGARSYEVWWDGSEKQLQMVLACEKSDMAGYRQAFRNMYPGAGFAEVGPVPSWFDPAGKYRVFDVGVYHGHYATVFDKARAHQLMSQIASTVQLSSKAWIQFVFKSYSFNPFLRRHVARLDGKVREIRRGNYLSNTEILMHPDKKPHDHPEAGRDFDNNYAGLQKHATLKMQGSHVLMSVRGLMVSDDEIDLNFDEIEALPVESVRSGHEHLTKFRYRDAERWQLGSKKSVIRAGGQRLSRLEMFPRRLLTDPEQHLEKALSGYCGRGLFGYKDRRPLPFLMLTLPEMPLLVHLPSPSTPNLDTTRGVAMPTKPSEKEGGPLGSFAPGAGAPEWGLTVRSKDAEAAVVSPSDFATHLYAVGGSGSGKTSLIRLLAKHLEAWNVSGQFPNAFIYVDPKGDDSRKFVQQCLPGSLEEGRVHYLDPQETRFSINPLELPPHKESEREEVVSRYVGYFMKTIEEWYQQSASYVQMERIFRALLFYMYMKHDAPTFLDMHGIILRLQGGKDALADVIREYGEPDPEMAQALESISSLKGDAFVPLLNRVEQFATDPVLKRMFSVRRGTVDFDELTKPGSCTVVRISPLNMPQHVQPLAMQAFILKLWFTIQERADRTPERDRTQVVLALDEFQIVKDLQVLQLMLEQARSLGLGLVLSHQTTEQISDRQLGIITGNSGTQFVGRVNGRDAARISQIWDPQFQKPLQHQLASQEYFHWTVREKAPPGKEQPPPSQFWLSPPPGLVSAGMFEQFVSSQLAKYGSGVVEGAARAAGPVQWKASLDVDVPPRTEWRIMLLLSEKPMQQVEIAMKMKTANRAELLPVLKAMVAKGILRRTDGGRAAPYELSPGARKSYFEPDVAPVGSADDVEGVARQAFEAYLKQGFFVAVADQTVRRGVDRTDLAAYDYETKTPVSIEIESVSEVRSHPEHVRYNMTKWRGMGFGMCHVWSKSRAVLKVFEDLDEAEKKSVRVTVV